LQNFAGGYACIHLLSRSIEMNPRMTVFGLALVAGLFVAAQTVRSDDDKKKGHDHDHGEMSEQEKAMHEAYEKAGTPGKHHARLNLFVGDWKSSMKMMMGPGDPQISEGTCSYEWILNNHYLASTYKADFGGMPFEGRGTMGYDNVLGRYWSTWIDNTSTGCMAESGACDESGKNFTMAGKSTSPMLGREAMTKSTIEVVSNDKHILRMWNEGPDGSLTQWAEITYTRVK
jgi:hypothetical protein